MDTEGKEWRTVPYLARKYLHADDLKLYEGSDYLDDRIIGPIHDRDVAVTPVRTTDSGRNQLVGEDFYRYPTTIYHYAIRSQLRHNGGIVHQRHNKGIPILQICDVTLQLGNVKYSWKLVGVTDKECKLEIKPSDNGEQVKETVRFCFVANVTDKLQCCFVDGYKVSYLLHTDAIRLGLQLGITLSSPPPAPDLTDFCAEVNLETECDGYFYTIHLLPERPPTKKLKLSPSSKSFELSITRNVPRNLRRPMKLVVKLKDSSDDYHWIYPYKIPVDQEDYFHFDDVYTKINICWGCCVDVGKGLCTEVCTCEPAEFIGFCQPEPGEGGCSKDTEE